MKIGDLRIYDLRKVILELLEDGVSGLLVALEVVTVTERLDGLLLFAGECPWHVDADVHHEVTLATAIALYGRQAFATQTEGLAWLGAILQFHPQLGAFDGGYLYLSAKGCCGEVEQQVVDQVVAVTDEGVVVFLLDEHLYIAVDTIMLAGVSLARHVDNHSFSHSGGDVDLNDLFTFFYTGAATVLTLVFDHLSLTITCRTDALLLHHTEDALGGMRDDTLTMTRRTSLLATASLGTRTAAMRTGDILTYLEFLRDTLVDLFQCELHFQSQVTATVLLRTA